MSLDDTAENKDISKKLREEDTDRQESKEYLRIIAMKNTKQVMLVVLLGRKRSWYGCKKMLLRLVP